MRVYVVQVAEPDVHDVIGVFLTLAAAFSSYPGAWTALEDPGLWFRPRNAAGTNALTVEEYEATQ